MADFFKPRKKRKTTVVVHDETILPEKKDKPDKDYDKRQDTNKFNPEKLNERMESFFKNPPKGL